MTNFEFLCNIADYALFSGAAIEAKKVLPDTQNAKKDRLKAIIYPSNGLFSYIKLKICAITSTVQPLPSCL